MGIIPLQGVDVEQHGAGSVGVVRDMNPSAGQLPDEPGFYGSEQQFPSLGGNHGTGDVFQNPMDFGGGKIGVNHQPGFLPDGFRQSRCPQMTANVRCPAALPNDGVAHRLTGVFIPHNGRFPLVGDANGGNVCGAGTNTGKRLPGNGQLSFKNFIRIVLHPAGLWENLGKFLLRHSADIPRLVK